MLSYECRITVAILRLLAVFTVVGYVFDAEGISLIQLTNSTMVSKPEDNRRNILYLALAIVCVNFFIRRCVRFLAAMKMRLLNVFHPAFFVVPVFILLPYVTCESIPFCPIRDILGIFELNWHCARWRYLAEPFSDFYITVPWCIIYIFWSYSFVDGKKYKAANEIIDSMSLLLNGFEMESSVVVFRYGLGKKELIEAIEDNVICTGDLKIINSEIDKTVTLYICATMWHETKNEMTQMIKSILR